MTILLHNHPQNVTQEEFEKDLLLLPHWRQEKALRFRFLIDRVLCTKAYLLLKQGLSSSFDITTNPEFSYIGHEKPILKDYPNIHFNLSHCKKGVLCVIDHHDIGCDIEEIETELDMDLCRHCFSNSEIADILSSSSPCVQFTVWWTRKEAYLKLTGTGLVDDLPALFTTEVMNRIKFETSVDEKHGYIYTSCSYINNISVV